MFFEDDSEDRSSLVVNSVDSVIPHSGISISFDQMLPHHHQIRSDVIESGVHIPHLNQSLIDRNQLLSMTAFGYSLTTELTSCSPRVTYLPGLIVFLHKMASRWYGLSPKISFARALRYTDWLPSFSDSLIPSRTRPACVITLTIDHHFLCLGNLPWTLHIFPNSVHTSELSVFIIANQ